MVALRAGSAYVDILPRVAKSFGDEIDRAARPALEDAGKKASGAFSGVLKTAATAAGGLLAAGAVKDLVGDAISAASDLNEATNVTGLIFKDARGEIDEFVKSSANIGLSEAKARELTGSIGGLLANMGLAQDETVDWTKKLTTLGADMGSAFNAEPAEAIQAIGSALRGEAEPIRRFNVVLSDAAMKAEAMRLGLVKAAVDETKVARARVGIEKATTANAAAIEKYGKDSLEARDAAAKLATAQAGLEKALEGSNVELTQQQKTQATLSLITKQTAAVQGDFANTSDGLANRQRILAARMENVKAKIGTALLPIVTKLGEVFAGLFPHVEKLAAGMGPAMAKVTAVVKGLFDLFAKGDFTGGLGRALGVEEDSPLVANLFKVRDAGLRVVDFVKETLIPAFSSIVDFVRDHLKPILLGLGAVFVLISPTAFIAALVAAYLKFEGFRNVVDGVVRFVLRVVVPAFVSFGKMVAGVIGDLVAYVQRIWPQVSEAIGHVFAVIEAIVKVFVAVIGAIWRTWGDDLGRIVGAAFGFVKATIENVLTLIRNVIGFVLAVINGDWGKAWDALKGIVGTVFEQIKDTVAGAFGILEGLFGGIVDTLGNAWNGLWEGMKAVARAAFEFIATHVLNPLIDGLNTAIRGANLINPGSDIPSIPRFTFDTAPTGGGGGGPALHLAAGGAALPGRYYTVGEEGPELLRMGSVGGHVFPNDELAALGAGFTIEHLEVHGGDAPVSTARETVRELRKLAYLTGSG